MHTMDPLSLSGQDFRRLAAEVVDLSAEYLAHLPARAIFPATSGEACERLFATSLPEKGLGPGALAALRDVMEHSRAQNGRFFGYVQGPGEPVAALGDLFASVLNQNMTAWRSSPAGVTVERTVVRWLAQAVGCKDFTGTLTGGGSSANLMGLAMAREAKAPGNETGVPANGVVYASTEIHMSIPKSIALLGIGRKNLRLIATDQNYRMIPRELEAQMARDTAAGKRPIAVVASAGTVNTGAIDPLREMAEIAHRHDAWFHIDGAYGALAAIAHREKFEGIELADSISLDPHKWLYQPLDCGCLLYRSFENARKTFSHSGEYARSLTEDPIEGFAFFEESLELSRRFRALKLWLALRYHGFGAFRESIRKDIEQAQRLVDAIRSEPKLELVASGELSAVCFCHRGTDGVSGSELNTFNAALLKRTTQR